MKSIKYIFIVSFFLGAIYLLISVDRHEPFELKGSDRENPAARKHQEYLMTRNPETKKIPDHIRLKETEFVKGISIREKNKLNGITFSGHEWKQIGPINVGGRTRALEMDIQNTNILIAGGVSGGVFKSTNRGESWYRVSPKSSVYGVTAIVQDTREGKTNNWYYGSGEYLGNSVSFDGAAYYGNGIYHSSDNGETWSVIPETYSEDPTSFDTPFKYVYNMKIDPSVTDETRLYVAAAGGIYRVVSDGGETEVQLVLGELSDNGNTFTDIDIAANGVMYAALSPATLGVDETPLNWGVFRSVDGINWENLFAMDLSPETLRIVLDIYEADENILFVLAETPGTGSTGHSLWRIQYDPAGAIWTDNYTPNIPDENWGDPFDSQNSYNLVVSVHPEDEDYVFIGGTNLYRSTDGFSSNSNIEKVAGYGADDVIPGSWVDQHKIIYAHDNKDEMFLGNDGGVRRAVDCTADNIVWEDKNINYITSQFYSIDLIEEVEGSAYMIGGLQDRDAWLTDEFDGSKPWQRINITADGAFCEFTKNVFPVYVSAQESQIIRVENLDPLSETNATLITPDITEDVLFINPFLLDPNDQNVMYIASYEGIWRNYDLSEIPTGGMEPTDQNWELIESTFPDSYITALGISREPEHILYYGTEYGRLFRFENSYDSFDDPVDITGDNFPEGYISSIFVDPYNADNLIISFSNYEVISIFASDDGGENWEAVAGNLEEFSDGSGRGPSVRWVGALLLDTSAVILAGTSSGLYSSDALKGMDTEWVKEGDDIIGNAAVSMIKTRNSDGTVLVSSLGSGVFYTQIDDEITSALDESLNNNFDLAQNYPNPFNPVTKIKYSLSISSPVTLTVYDILGKEVARLVNKRQSAGSYEVDFNASELASGTYIYRLKAGNFSASKKMLLVK